MTTLKGKRLAFLALLLATGAQAQQRQPASITTIPSATPQSLYWLDKVGAWQPLTSTMQPNQYGAKCDGAADDAPAFTALFAAPSVIRIPRCSPSYYLGSSVLPGPGNNFIPPYNPGFVRLPVATDLASQWIVSDPTAKFIGPGKIDLHYLFPYIGSPVMGDDVLIHTFADSEASAGYLNYMVRSTIAYNSGTTSINTMPVVAEFAEGISNCGASTAVLNCPAWAQNLAAFTTADNGHVWGTEIDVGDLSPSGNGTVWALDIHSIGQSLSTHMFGIHMMANQPGGFTFGWNLDAANGNSPIQAVGSIIVAGGSATVAHGIDFSRWNFTTDAFSSPGFKVDGSGVVTNSGDIISAKATSGSNIGSNFLYFNLFDSAGTAHSVKFWATNSSTLPVFQMVDASGGTGINFILSPGGTTETISGTGNSNLVLTTNGSGTVRSGTNFVPLTTNTYTLGTAGLLWNGVYATLPASAGAGGLTVCVDSAGVFYKKATCP